MKSVLSAVRSMADKSRLDESAATGRDDRSKLWGLEAAIPRRMGATTRPWDGRADGEGGESEWRARRDGVIVGTKAGLCQAGRDRASRDGGVGLAGRHQSHGDTVAEIGNGTRRGRPGERRSQRTSDRSVESGGRNPREAGSSNVL